MNDDLGGDMERARLLLETMATPGWAIVEAVFKMVRTEAFEEWSALAVDAPTEKQLGLKAKERVARDIRQRLQDVVTHGAEAAEQAQARREAEREADDFALERATADQEVQGLLDPKIS